MGPVCLSCKMQVDIHTAAVGSTYCRHVRGDLLHLRSSVFLFLYHALLWFFFYIFMAFLRTSVAETDVEWNLSWPLLELFLRMFVWMG